MAYYQNQILVEWKDSFSQKNDGRYMAGIVLFGENSKKVKAKFKMSTKME